MKTTQLLYGVKGRKVNSSKSRSIHEAESFRQYRKEAIKSAEGLLYGDDVINQILNAETEIEINRIMKTARKKRTAAEDLRNDQDVMKRVKELKCQKKKK